LRCNERVLCDDTAVIRYNRDGAKAPGYRLDAQVRQLAWPDGRNFVDSSWAAEGRERVARHLEVWTLVNRELAISFGPFAKRRTAPEASTTERSAGQKV
jgi:hypothetical protein